MATRDRQPKPPNGGLAWRGVGIHGGDATVRMGTRDRGGDLPAERGAHPVSPAALLHPAGRPVRPPPAHVQPPRGTVLPLEGSLQGSDPFRVSVSIRTER